MFENYIYVLVDSVSNHVLSRGIQFNHFQKAMNRKPQNLLLLSGPKNLGIFDEYTRFNVIRGEAKVTDFLTEQTNLNYPNVKWIDFNSPELYHQLTPDEIAELLYLAHANRHLRSPFFYKLQNNYVCLPLENKQLKVYYRHINEFYFQLSNIIREKTQQQRMERKSLFSLRQSFAKNHRNVVIPSMELMQSLRPLLYEGVILDFKQVDTNVNDPITIPIYLAEDQLDEIMERRLETELLGKLLYYEKEERWALELTREDAPIGG